jgi:hypothetical protein
MRTTSTSTAGASKEKTPKTAEESFLYTKH